MKHARQISVQIELTPDETATRLKELRVRNDAGKLMPLSSVVSVRCGSAPRVIERFNMYPSVGITANTAEGITLNDACEAVEEAYKEMQTEKGFGFEWRRGRPVPK